MGAEARRKKILQTLRIQGQPVTGSDLAETLEVSRQVIVQDIALLRARGANILATPRGYVLSPIIGKGITSIIASVHSIQEVEDELMTIVRLGGEVLDVVVEHPIYGQITGTLLLRSPEDVAQFVASLQDSGAKLLSSLTGGTHLHTIRTPDRKTLASIEAALQRKGYVPAD